MTNEAKALTWVLREAAELSSDRLPGLRQDNPAAAENELADLLCLAKLALSLGADPAEIDAITALLACG